MSDAHPDLRRRLARRHHLIGWCGLLVFLSLGIGLETLHGLKLGFYLDPPHRLRRLLWTLAHAHGTLLAVVNIAFAAGLTQLGRWNARSLRIASFLLIDALVLLPAGFFLGGIGHTEVDPSPWVLLVPVGAAFLLVAVALIAWSAARTPDDSGPPSPPPAGP
jgi:hypothetical protein